MCSAIQPSCRAMFDAMRRARHFPEQGIAAVARAVGPDQVLLREMADILFLDRGAGPQGVFLSGRERRSDGVQTRNKFALFLARPAPCVARSR